MAANDVPTTQELIDACLCALKGTLDRNARAWTVDLDGSIRRLDSFSLDELMRVLSKLRRIKAAEDGGGLPIVQGYQGRAG